KSASLPNEPRNQLFSMEVPVMSCHRNQRPPPNDERTATNTPKQFCQTNRNRLDRSSRAVPEIDFDKTNPIYDREPDTPANEHDPENCAFQTDFTKRTQSANPRWPILIRVYSCSFVANISMFGRSQSHERTL